MYVAIRLLVLTKTAKNSCPRSPLPPVPVSLPSLPLGLPAELQLAAAAKQREQQQQQQQQQQQAEKRRLAAMEEIRAAEAKRRRVAEREDEEMSPRYGIVISFFKSKWETYAYQFKIYQGGQQGEQALSLRLSFRGGRSRRGQVRRSAQMLWETF